MLPKAQHEVMRILAFHLANHMKDNPFFFLVSKFKGHGHASTATLDSMVTKGMLCNKRANPSRKACGSEYAYDIAPAGLQYIADHFAPEKPALKSANLTWQNLEHGENNSRKVWTQAKFDHGSISIMHMRNGKFEPQVNIAGRYTHTTPRQFDTLEEAKEGAVKRAREKATQIAHEAKLALAALEGV